MLTIRADMTIDPLVGEPIPTRPSRSMAVVAHPPEGVQLNHAGFVVVPGTRSRIATLLVMARRESDGEEGVMGTLEIPELVDFPRTRRKQESDDLAKFFLATRLVFSGHAYRLNVGPENAPPDALLTIDESEVYGIEATQLHIPGAVQRWHAFDRIRAVLLGNAAELRDRLGHHRGSLVQITFEDELEQPRLPDKRTGPEDVLRLLEETRPTRIPGDASPEDVHHAPIVRLDDIGMSMSWSLIPEGASVEGFLQNLVARVDGIEASVTWSPLPQGHQSTFLRAMGFEMALANPYLVFREDVRREIRRLIGQHDKPGVDLLVISLNAPIASGLWLPSDQAIRAILITDDDPLQGWTPQHIRMVALHNQRSDVAEFRVLVGQDQDLFQRYLL